MKKISILSILLLFLAGIAFAFKAETPEDEQLFYKSIGLNNEQIIKVHKINNSYNLKIEEALNKSREYRKKYPTLSKEEGNDYLNKMLNRIDKEREREINKFMNPWQKNRYLEYKSRVY